MGAVIVKVSAPCTAHGENGDWLLLSTFKACLQCFGAQTQQCNVKLTVKLVARIESGAACCLVLLVDLCEFVGLELLYLVCTSGTHSDVLAALSMSLAWCNLMHV